MALTADWTADFNRYTLTLDNYRTVCLSTIVVYLAYFSLCYLLIKEKKRLAWCITLLNSLSTTLLCLVYCSVKTYTSTGIFNSNVTLLMIHGNDNISAITCTVFACVNILDLILGLIFYRSQLGLMTTYIHHSLYTWLMFFLVTGNGLFVTTPTPFSMAFIWCLIEEFPTFLLALGTIFPSLRADLSFGVSFFLLRLLYHSFLFLLMVRMEAYTPMLFLYGLTFAMHLEWFRVWFKKYGVGYLSTASNSRKQK
jgi:hypothetical protein